jgi:hypothetical protein
MRVPAFGAKFAPTVLVKEETATNRSTLGTNTTKLAGFGVPYNALKLTLKAFFSLLGANNSHCGQIVVRVGHFFFIV